MTKIVLLVVSSILFFILYSYTKKEGITNNQQLILLGDSILENSNYVLENETVLAQLPTKNVLSLAKDHSTISDLYSQMQNIPIHWNSINTCIFISIGGNDLLTRSINAKDLFKEYNQFLQKLKAKMSETNIFVFNLYMPLDVRYAKYKPMIEEWNKCLENLTIVKIVDLFSVMVSPNDFVAQIEPSPSGSKKIANLITNACL
jgi:hypothetical protein